MTKLPGSGSAAIPETAFVTESKVKASAEIPAIGDCCREGRGCEIPESGPVGTFASDGAVTEFFSLKFTNKIVRKPLKRLINANLMGDVPKGQPETVERRVQSQGVKSLQSAFFVARRLLSHHSVIQIVHLCKCVGVQTCRLIRAGKAVCA